MAIAAVSAALSKFNDELSRLPPCEVDERVEDLVIELTWMQCFLVDGERTVEGRARAGIWSPTVERLALCAQDLQSGWVSSGLKVLGMEKLTKRLAALREKMYPFVTSHVGCSSSYVAKVPDPPPAMVELDKEIKVGAWGGGGGEKWDYKPKRTLTQIVIVHGIIIDSITLTSVSQDGKTTEVPAKFGGGGGSNTTQVNINTPSEYLTGISGTYGVFNNLNVIKSLKFYTNMRQHGPIGSNTGKPFSCILEESKIVGLHGRCGLYLDSIGIYISPK